MESPQTTIMERKDESTTQLAAATMFLPDMESKFQVSLVDTPDGDEHKACRCVAQLFKCAICEHPFSTNDRFFRSDTGISDAFILCLECALHFDNDQKEHHFRPCFLDPRDSRPTLLSCPPFEEFKASLVQLQGDEYYTLPDHVQGFLDLSILTEQSCVDKTTKINAVLTKKVLNDYSLYQKLAVKEKHIRLFRLNKGSHLDPISGTIARFCDPWNQVKWFALSYRWGDLGETRNIQVDHELSHNQTFQITANLEMALRGLRSEKHNIWLWVDALCINQGDLEERTSQVEMMREIFRRSSKTIVWLESNKDELTGITLIMAIGMCVEELYRTRVFSPQEEFSTIATYLSKHLELSVGQESPESRDMLVMKKLSKVFDNLWFHRAWVLQEIANTKGYAIVHARHDLVLTWKHLIIANLLFCIYFHNVDAGSVEYLAVGSLQPIWNGLTFRRERPMLDLVDSTFGTFQATDARDKIFSLLAMAQDLRDSPELSRLVRADYKKSAKQVYVDFTRWCILHYRSLEILGSATYTARPPPSAQVESEDDRDWPSWAFSYCRKLHALPTHKLPRMGNFNASGSNLLDLSSMNPDYDGQHCLTLQGYVLGPITWAARQTLAVNWLINDEVNIHDHETRVLHGGGVAKLWWLLTHRGGQTFETCGDSGDTSSDPCPYRKVLDDMLLLLTCDGWDSYNGVYHQRPPCDIYAEFAAYWVSQGKCRHDPLMETFCKHIRSTLLPLVGQKRPRAFLDTLRLRLGGDRCPFMVGNDPVKFGLSPREARKDDAVVILNGGKTPFILRQNPTASPKGATDTSWKFIGECYVRGLMQGEHTRACLEEGLPEEVFHIV